MSGQQYYGGVIWTNHALSRLSERGFTQDIALSAFKHPDQTAPSREGGTEFKKRVEKSTVTVIAKQNEKSEWVIVSCWVNPPLFGTEDYKKREAYRRYQKASFWGKFFLTLKKQLGL